MLRLLKVLFFLAIIAFVGLTGFAYFGDMGPEPVEQSVPVDLNAQ